MIYGKKIFLVVQEQQSRIPLPKGNLEWHVKYFQDLDIEDTQSQYHIGGKQ